MEMVDGRKNEGDGVPGSEAEIARGDRCAGEGRRKPPGKVSPVNFDANVRTFGQIEARYGGKGRECGKAAIGTLGGHGRREKDSNGKGGESQYPGALSEKGLRASSARNEERESVGALGGAPGWPPDRPLTGRLWKPDTGTRHLSPLNVVETAGPRMLAAVSQANKTAETDQPDWKEFEDAAESLCPQIGIGPQTWCVAVTVMGRRAAAICVMLIDRKMCPDAEDPVRSPGAYLRGMTSRARKDELHLHASVFGRARRVAA